ncbi:hypothetical protein ACMFMG_011516 [Clarireedia jacksonii]
MNFSIATDKTDPQRKALYKAMEIRQKNEYERLRMQHELRKGAMGGVLVRVPLSKQMPTRILDSATEDGLSAPDDFKLLKEAVVEEMANVGNTWRFWVITAEGA